MMKKQERIGPGTVIAALIALGGAMLLCVGAIRVYHSYASLRWAKAEGVVLSSGVAEIRGEHGSHFEPDVAYSYSFGSNTYVNNRIRFVPIKGDVDAAKKFIQRYPRGKAVVIRCKPSNPSVSVLEPGAFPNTWLYAILGALTLASVAGVCRLYWILKRKAAADRALARKNGNKPVVEKSFREGLREEIQKAMDKAELPVERSILPTVVWTLVTALVFWWLGRWATPVTVLGEILLLLLAISMLFLVGQTLSVPAMKPLPDPDGPARAPEPRDRLEAEIQVLGFRHIGDFDPGMRVGKADRVRAYVAPDGVCGAVLMDFQTGRRATSTILEFSTTLHPSGSINVNNGRFPDLFAYKLDKIVAHAPWKTSASDLLQLHQELCRVARDENFTSEPVLPGQFAEKVRDGSLKDFECQVDAGRCRKVAEGQYRMSLRGALIAVPILWYLHVYGRLFSWFKLPDRFFCRKFRRRLRRFKRRSATR